MHILTIALEVFLWGIVFLILGIFGILAIGAWYGGRKWTGNWR